MEQALAWRVGQGPVARLARLYVRPLRFPTSDRPKSRNQAVAMHFCFQCRPVQKCRVSSHGGLAIPPRTALHDTSRKVWVGHNPPSPHSLPCNLPKAK